MKYIIIYIYRYMVKGKGKKLNGNKGFDTQSNTFPFCLASPNGPNTFVQVSDNSRLCHAPENNLQQAQEREWQSTILQTKQPELRV